MGATASCGPASSRAAPPSLPVNCGMLETKESATCLFTVPHYSKWARMPAGTALNFDPLFVLGTGYCLKVYPAGFDKESADFVAVFFSVHSPFDSLHEGVNRVSFEILDEAGERAVFSNHTARSGQTLENGRRSKGYVRFVNRRELEWSSCVCRRDDSFTVRCTLSVDVEVSRLPAEVFAADQALSSSNCLEPAAETMGEHYTFTINRFSNVKTALPIGECVHSLQFSFGGSSWYLKVYPNGYCNASRDCVSVFLGRGRSDERETTADFRFKVIGLVGAAGEGERMRHTFDHNKPVHGTRCLVKSSDLALAEHMASDDDCLVIHCHLRVIKVTTPRVLPAMAPPPLVIAPPYDGLEHHLKVPARCPPIVGEENVEPSESAALLSDMYYD